MTENAPYLQTARQAIQNGQLENAVKILTAILSQNDKNAEAWFLLSAAVEDQRTSADCLRNALVIDPQHAGAVQMMRQLEQQSGLKPISVMRVGSRSAAFGHTCPYCASRFNLFDEVVACPQCATNHHWDCWQESGHTCAAGLCKGFSLSEIRQPPLPEQPPAREAQVIVIRKEDIPETGKASREEQERHFQRRLLMLALMKEEGLAPVSGPLPSADEILTLMQPQPPNSGRLPVTGSADDIRVAHLRRRKPARIAVKNIRLCNPSFARCVVARATWEGTSKMVEPGSVPHKKVGITVVDRENLITVSQTSPPLLAQNGLSLVGASPEGQLQILVSQEAFATINTHATSDISHEVGGFLVGRPYDWNDLHYVEVIAAVPGEFTSASMAHLTLSPDTWAHAQATVREKFPDMHIVGWYHTHPRMGVFLSGQDLAIQEGFFRQPWHVALVIEPVSREAGFFVWESGQVREASGYRVAFPQNMPTTQGWQQSRSIYTSISSTTWDRFYEAGCWHTHWTEADEVAVKVRPGVVKDVRTLASSPSEIVWALCRGRVRTNRTEQKPFYFIEVVQVEPVIAEDRGLNMLKSSSALVKKALQLIEGKSSEEAQLFPVIGVYCFDPKHRLSAHGWFEAIYLQGQSTAWRVVLVGDPYLGIDYCFWKAADGEMIRRTLVEMVNLDEVSEDGLPRMLADIKAACQQLLPPPESR